MKNSVQGFLWILWEKLKNPKEKIDLKAKKLMMENPRESEEKVPMRRSSSETCIKLVRYSLCFTSSQIVPPSLLSLSDWVWLDFGVESLDLGVPEAEVFFMDYGSKDVGYVHRGHWWFFFFFSIRWFLLLLLLKLEVHWFWTLWF